MRDLTKREIKNKPEWATHFKTGDGGFLLFESLGLWQRFDKGNKITDVIKNADGGISEGAKKIPFKYLSEKERTEQTKSDIKHILDNCAPGKEVDALMFALQFNRITNVTWGK